MSTSNKYDKKTLCDINYWKSHPINSWTQTVQSLLEDLPQHAVAQSGPQGSGSKVTDVSPMKALFS